MCGRFTIRSSPHKVAQAFGLAGELPLFAPRYNVAPTQMVLAVRLENGQRKLAQLKWGLVPAWADDPALGNKLFNARADTVAEKPSFRSAFKKSRCLVVADGFYEWKTVGKKKQPYFIRRRDDEPFALAGLMEHWQRGNQQIDSCALITTEPNELMSPIHDRMPVILPPSAYDVWLDRESQDRAQLQALLRPYPAEELQATAVSTLVSNARNEGPGCIAPAEPTLFDA